MKDDLCTYCGDYAQCRDHVIPVNFLSVARSYSPTKNWIVPSCNDCNTMAGSKVFFSVPEKARYIKSRFERRHSKILKHPEWSQEELNDVSYQIREMVWGGLVAKRVAKERLEYFDSVMEKPSDFLMPEFIKKQIKELIVEMEKIEKERKKRLRSRKRTENTREGSF